MHRSKPSYPQTKKSVPWYGIPLALTVILFHDYPMTLRVMQRYRLAPQKRQKLWARSITAEVPCRSRRNSSIRLRLQFLNDLLLT